MPTPITTGSSAAFIQKQTVRSDPSRGQTIITDIKGINASVVAAAASGYGFDGVAYDFSQERGIASLTANDATGNNPIDVWELIGNDERKDLFQNPIWGNSISDDQMAAIRKHLDNDDTPTQAFADTALSGLAGGVAQRAYARYQAGNDEFENDAYGGGYVLRHTTNAPARWAVNIADFNVGYIYPTAALLSEVSNGGLWTYPIPTRLYYKIANIPFPSLREYFQWGWKKGRSNEETTANNRVNIVTSYVLEQWSTDDYFTY